MRRGEEVSEAVIVTDIAEILYLQSSYARTGI